MGHVKSNNFSISLVSCEFESSRNTYLAFSQRTRMLRNTQSTYLVRSLINSFRDASSNASATYDTTARHNREDTTMSIKSLKPRRTRGRQ